MLEHKESRYAIRSVESALAVLEALSEAPDEVPLAHLSQTLKLSKARVFRLLATFEQRGYVEKEKGGRYRLGGAAFEIGRKLLLRLSLLRKARPVMESLAWKCNEAVYLGIRRGSDVLLLDMIDTREQVKVVPLLGNRYPLCQVAAGKVLAASPLPGQAADCGALGAGIASLAVPLRNAAGAPSGALCLVGPEFRFTPERIENELLPSLQEAAAVVSSRVGFHGAVP